MSGDTDKQKYSASKPLRKDYGWKLTISRVKFIGSAIEVHKALGPGLLESVYEECLCHEFDLRGIPYKRQHAVPVQYKGAKLDCGYRIDILVDNRVILELKSVDCLEPIHEAQTLTYLKLTGFKVGLLINFNVPALRDGIKRLIF